MSTTETKFVNRHRAVDDKPAFRLYKEGEIVELQCGPYGDFDTDMSLLSLLNQLAYGVGAIKASEHGLNVATLRVLAERVESDTQEGADAAEEVEAMIEGLIEALNNALITDDEADPDRIPSWGYYEGTVFLHRASWWYQEADESAVNAWTTTEHPKEAVKPDTFTIIVEGNPVDGFNFYGPYASFEAANEAADEHLRSSGSWWTMSLDKLENLS